MRFKSKRSRKSRPNRGTDGQRSVLVLATNLSNGGGVNRVLTHLAELFTRELGCQTTLLSARSSAPPTYPVHPDVDLRLEADGGGFWHYVRTLWRLRRQRFDVVVGPWTHENLLLTVVFLGTSTRIILMEHAQWQFQHWPVRIARRLVYPLAWRVCALNPTEFDHYSRFLSNVVLMPNPVCPVASVETARGRQIIAIGHLTPLKNFGDTIKAMALSGLEQEGWSLTIIGKGSERERLRRMICRLNLASTSIEAPGQDLTSWYTNASLLMHTSKMEVFPMVLAESMAAGVVPIAYNADGRRFILEGFAENLVPFGDVEAVAVRLRYFANLDLARTRRELSRSVEERFSPAVIADRWRQLFACLE